MTDWQPVREPLLKTIRRNFAIATVAGGVVASTTGGLKWWPLATATMFWPTFGGHFLELWFLNWLRPRLPEARAIHIVARLSAWFAGGLALGLAMRLTALAVTGRSFANWPWWAPGLAFIGVELIAQAAIQLRGLPSFYNARG